MIRVVLQQSPTSIFMFKIDGLRLSVPEHFRPAVGDTLRFDLVLSDTDKLVPLMVFVTAIEWRLGLLGDTDYTATMHLTVASDKPSTHPVRRVHGGKR